MVAHATPEQKSQFELFASRRKGLMDMLRRTREKLEAVYKQGETDEQKAAGKQAVFAAMREEYAQLRAGWGGFSGYDAWLNKDLNNAKLGSIATYNQLVPAFDALLKREHGDLPLFYAEVKRLAKLSRGERDKALAELAPGAPS
jgi:predicted aminopeptidase